MGKNKRTFPPVQIFATNDIGSGAISLRMGFLHSDENVAWFSVEPSLNQSALPVVSYFNPIKQEWEEIQSGSSPPLNGQQYHILSSFATAVQYLHYATKNHFITGASVPLSLQDKKGALRHLGCFLPVDSFIQLDFAEVPSWRGKIKEQSEAYTVHAHNVDAARLMADVASGGNILQLPGAAMHLGVSALKNGLNGLHILNNAFFDGGPITHTPRYLQEVDSRDRTR